jgi:hypothetical protein
MRLLFCRDCADVVKLHRHVVRCQCGQARGRYLEDGWHAEVWGERAEVIGLNNADVLKACGLNVRTSARGGPPIEAWMMAHDYERVRRNGLWRDERKGRV